MSIFNGNRLTNTTFKLDVDRMRGGWYSDKYFENIGHMFDALARQGYTFHAESPRIASKIRQDLFIAEMAVEIQWFVRRRPLH
jgi:nicotinate phosphoribosyltransferase